ncbi:SDR family oxidoreductase [Cumulibacter manganitolerans]|uniref:SDR family oxidoreductase n=1 Tax=Cumulibacter manganitolerans TaxID=1884992 RepID=UPI001294DD5B|nr:SDR family oxidoreductase [Cumulibacter manganitolerans]
MKLDSNVSAVVTGGASGLARATATALAEQGVKVAIFDLNEDGGKQVAKEIGATFHKVDVTDEDSAVAGFEEARAANGQERILVHCAQVSRGGKTLRRNRDTGELTRLPTEDFAFSAEGILVASYRMASLSALGMAGLEPMEDDERGCITLTGSVAAQDAQIGQICYGSAKAGVAGLALPLARDLMDLGIRANTILPGIFETPPMLAVKDRAPQVFEGLNRSVPFPKRLGRPSEFASLVLELNRNCYFNGQVIRLDGAIRMPPK